MRTPRSLSALAVATAIAVALLVLFSGSTPAATQSSATAAEPYRPDAAWKQIETLMIAGSYEEAAEVAARLREAARAAGDEENQTRALVQEAQLRRPGLQPGAATAAGPRGGARRAARAARGEGGNRTRALVQEVQLRSLDLQTGEAYEVLRQAEWPRNTTDRAILHLYAALLLDRYYDSRR